MFCAETRSSYVTERITGPGNPLIVAPPGEICSPGAGHAGLATIVMLPVSFAPIGSILPATNGCGAGCGSAYTEPPAICGCCSHTIARPGARSEAVDPFVVWTMSRLRGAPPGVGSGTVPASVTTIVSFPSRNACPNSATCGLIGMSSVDVVAARVVGDGVDARE